MKNPPKVDCYICGSKGKLLYHALKDRIFDAPGEWNLKKCLNPECGLIWLDPILPDEDIINAYKNYYTHQNTENPNTLFYRLYHLIKLAYLGYKYGYNIKPLTLFEKLLGMLIYIHPGYRANFDFSVMYLPFKQKGQLLEIGCGNGQMLKFMQDLGWCTEGIDIDPSAVLYARSKGLKVHTGTLETIKYHDENFDAIIISHVIEHVHEPLRMIVECYRILKQTGHLVIVTPNSESLGHSVFKNAWLHLDPPRHLYVFNVASLYNLVRKAGFQKFEVSTTIRDANGLFIASRSIKRHGKYVWNSSQPRHIRLCARCMQFIEFIFLKLKANIGEEIAMIAKK